MFLDGIKEMAKKVTEEAGEVAISAVTDDGRVKEESADLIYHLLVMLRKMDISFSRSNKCSRGSLKKIRSNSKLW